MINNKYFKRTLSYLKPYKVPYGIGTFLYCAQSFLIPIIFSVLMGGVTAGVLAHSVSQVMTSIWATVIVMLSLGMLIAIGTYMYVINMAYADRDLSLDVYSAFLRTGIESGKHSAEGIAALNTDTDAATALYGNALTPFLRHLIGAVFSAIATILIDWRIGLGAVVVGVFAFVIQSLFSKPLARLGKEQLEANADAVKSLSNILSGALTIKAYNRQDEAIFTFDKENGKLKKLAIKQAFIGMWQDTFTTVQGWLVLILVFGLGGYFVATGSMDFAAVMMILPFARAIGDSMSSIGASYASFAPALVAAQRVFTLIDSGGQPNEPMDADKHTQITDETKGYELTLKDLSFSYKDSPHKALDDINLTIDENQMIAFVGESGSGKSTILRTIIGMYERDDLTMEIGQIKYNPKEIEHWRSNFAYVDQSCKLFDMTIGENIALGQVSSVSINEDQQKIEAAAARAYASDFINELPDGYNTPCGEKGASLSGGQKQRIAIARALYRKAPILVFDEATSALDATSEASVMETIESLRTDHTILLTTHNLNNIITADKIAVMDNGRIAEFGTHVELLEKGGFYTKLWEKSHDS